MPGLKIESFGATYHIAQNFGGRKLWQINRFMSFGEENVGEFTIANIMRYFTEPNLAV